MFALSLKELHPFLRNPLQPNMDPIELQAVLANFRAIGPYIEKDEHERKYTALAPP